MSKYHSILFEESLPKDFPGFLETHRVQDLPVWGNFKVRNLLELSNTSSIPNTPFSIERVSDLEPLNDFLARSVTADSVIVGRTGSIAVLDWKVFYHIRKATVGIAKVHLGKAPSELYIIQRKKLREVLAHVGERLEQGTKSFCTLLFDDYLFHHFDRIIDLEGYSFLMRNSSEYFRQNLGLPSHLQDDRFLSLFARLKSPHSSKTTVSETGTVRNSFLGCGSRVKGEVENSIIFHDVHIAKNVHVRGSVILPFNTIEEGAVIENTLLLEGKDRLIERNVRIGGFRDVTNGDFPGLMQKGLSIIGHGITLPRNSQIGAGCLVYGRGEKKMTPPLVVEDGTSYRAL